MTRIHLIDWEYEAVDRLLADDAALKRLLADIENADTTEPQRPPRTP